MMTIATLILTLSITLNGNLYTAPMYVESNTTEECILVDTQGEAWAMDYDNTLTEGQTITVLMYNNNTHNTHIDDIIITYTTQ